MQINCCSDLNIVSFSNKFPYKNYENIQYQRKGWIIFMHLNSKQNILPKKDYFSLCENGHRETHIIL